MPLSVGSKLTHYEILAPIGAGGMGEVFRARDTKLEREVAIKILPASLARDPDRLARFEREAKVLASLNHPNIAAIYGLEDTADGRALVMELVPGDTLKKLLPVGTTLAYFKQIAEALETAHEKGIVHRDLKPGNIMVTPEGQVKVLDFGLAAVPSRAEPGSDPDNSPTMTMAATQAGLIMGTAAYMSPEQAAGTPVDRRADIWSFGVVLWETLTGERLFSGETMSHTLADVLRAPVDFDKLPAGTPTRVRELIQRCLDRDLKNRLRDIGEARVVLQRAIAEPERRTEVRQQAEGRATASKMLWPWAVAAAALIVMAMLGWRQWSAPVSADRPLIRLNVDLGPRAERDRRVSAILSPDGARIVYAAKGPGRFQQLYTRRLDQPTAVPLSAEAVRQTNPFFSPNGEWIGYWSGDKLMKVPSQGGEPVVIGDTPKTFLGASWGDDGNIIMGSNEGLLRISPLGGAAELLKGTSNARGWPQVLPGSQAILTESPGTGSGTADGHDIDVMRLGTGEQKNLLRGGYWPRYLPTSGETGHLVFLREGALYGVGFDPRSLTLLGAPTQLLNDVASNNALDNLGGQFAFSNNGTFVYLSGKPEDATYPIAWLDASGKVTSVVAQGGAYGSPRISPDSKLLAYIATGNSGARYDGHDLSVYDLARGTSTQLTFAGEVANEVAWAPDSKHLAYGDGRSLWWIRSDGAGQKQLLMDGKELGTTPLGPRPFSFSPGLAPSQGKGARLAFTPVMGGLPDIWTLPIDLTDPEHPKPGKPEPFLAAPAIVEVDPAFSPGGKFVAFSSNELGLQEVFVRPFPGPGGRWRVSTNGGQFPAWSPATHELFFLGGDDHIMVADYTIHGESFSVGIPRVWSPTPVRRHSVQLNFDISPDGKRVIMFPQPVVETSTGNLHATFLFNFFDEVRRRVPVGK